MSVLKSELKQLVTHEIGVRVDDALDGAKRELYVLEGKQVAFLEGAKAVELLLPHVDKDVEEGKYGLEVAAEIKKYVVRANNVLQNLSRESMNMVIAQTGKVQAFNHTVTLLKGMIDAEKAKAAQLAVSQTVSPVPGVGEAEGARPMSIKALRLAEEAAEEAVEKEVEKEPVQKALGKRGRRAKNA